MKKSKILTFILILSVLFQPLIGVTAFAEDLSDKTVFEYKLIKLEDGSTPGDIKAELYCQTDPEALITTLGATLVINTDYVDVVDKSGNVITDSYKQEVVALGRSFPVTASKIGESGQSFSSIKGLSLASYNVDKKLMYIFICGMAVSGIGIEGKAQIASFYLNSKTDGKLPFGAIRLMYKSEAGDACPSRAIFATEISSTKEVGTTDSSITLNADENLIETKAEKDTTKQTEPTSKESTSSDKEKQTTAPKTTKAVADMSEKEVETELKNIVSNSKKLNLSDSQKQSAEYKAYEKAVEKANEVLEKSDSTKEEKQQALEELREAEKALEEKYPELSEQLDNSGSKDVSSKTVILICVCSAAVIAAVAAVIIVLNKKKKNSL